MKKFKSKENAAGFNGEPLIVVPSAIQQVMDLIGSSILPRSAYWMRRRLDDKVALRIYSVLHQLENGRELEYMGDGTWRVVRANEDGGQLPFDPMKLIGPVWEPKVVEALKNRGLNVEQQRHELSYYLDIAIICHNGKKLNIEVDGRTHRRYDGRRRTADLIRDARLCSNGWTVHRIWVKDLITDFDGQIDQAVKTWKQLEGEE